jgi:hypothetical protein
VPVHVTIGDTKFATALWRGPAPYLFVAMTAEDSEELKPAPGHHGEVLAGFQLPEHWFHGAGPHLVVVAAAPMLHPPPGRGGDRELVQVQGPFRRAGAVPAGVFGQWCQQPQLVGVGAGEGLLADPTGEHGLQPRFDPGLGQLLAAGVQQGVQPAWRSSEPAPPWAGTTAWFSR